MAKTTQSIHKNHRNRVRAKFKNCGGAAFHDHELLEMMLFYSIPRGDTNETAHRLLERFGTLEKITSASIAELKMVDGVGEKSAIYLKMLFEYHYRVLTQVGKGQTFTTYEEIGDYFLKLFTHISVETMMVILFDKKGRITRTLSVATGDFVGARVDMKALISSAISESAHAVAVAHNHPSGVLSPSLDDRYITARIDDIMRNIDVKFIEHYIVSENGYIGVNHDSVI